MASKDTQTLSTDVIKRMMNDARFEEFLNEYNSSLKVHRSYDRTKSLGEPLTDEERTCLKAYLDETDVTIKELSEQHGYDAGHRFRSISLRAAVKFLYQNRRMLDF